ncbi:TlpA family protein disulfide reductase [Carboxylicivirga taeanensis]|uniref:TlpA family protein disulfide reductase n=1 Tax=Carboxylicivirga taeanensis TaxID=1416875 RepID=UPI003F6DCCBF
MKTLFLVNAIFLFCLSAFSQADMVGKKAPSIDIEKWVYPKIKSVDWQNSEVPESLEGKIIVIDFWFTECAPCVASIPQLNHLAKKYPEIVFLSVTFDNEKVIDEFLDKMIINYPIGIDTEERIINAFNVEGFPETFLIDKNGVIQWQGSPFHLNIKKVDELIGRQKINENIDISTQEVPINNSAYSFTIQEHNLEMGQSSYAHYNPYDINIFNKDLEAMLSTFYGINKSRVLTQDSMLLKTPYDLTLMADKDLTTSANCVEMLKYLLPEYLDIRLQEVKRDTIVGILKIENDSLLLSNKSNAKFYGTSIRYDNWEAKGATLVNLKNFLEDNYSKLVDINEVDERKYDFVIPSKNFNKAKETLLVEYGINVINQKTESEFWQLIKE